METKIDEQLLDAEVVISSLATLMYLTEVMVQGKGRNDSLSEDFNEVEHFFRLTKMLAIDYLKKYHFDDPKQASVEVRRKLYEFYTKGETDESKIAKIREVFEDYHGSLD